jgi:sigma-B regulation protein RsbU (phosphoserine phosphatase)
MWMLLGIGLIPLLLMTAFYQWSSMTTRRHIASQTRKGIEADTHSSLLRLIGNYHRTLERETALVNSIVTSQGREIEFRLQAESGISSEAFTSETFGLIPPHNETIPEVESRYYRQEFFLPDGLEPEYIADSMNRLHSMTPVYRQLHELLSGDVLWHYTTLENGLHTTYPGGSELPKPGFYDPRKRNWYIQAKEAQGEVVYIGPLVDAASDKVIYTIAKAVYAPDGNIAGVTAIDRTIPDMVNVMRLPQRYGQQAERYLVTFDPNNPVSLDVLLTAQYAEARQSWHRQIELASLTSDDVETFSEMVASMQAGKVGVCRMPYKGADSMWAYGYEIEALAGQPAVPVVIVPYTQVVELANRAEAYMLNQSVVWLEVSGFLLVLVLTVVVILTIWRSRAALRPIRKLAQAGRDLSKGDYSVKVDIQTGDELEELGMVFNEVGPKLQQVEKLQRSMELAGAIQKNLLPQNNPKLKKLDMAGRCRYCDETGGDYYDFIELVKIAPGKIGIALADVSGHGIGAALLMANVRSALRAVSIYCGDEPAKMLKELNLLMAKDTEDDKFMTLFYGIFDETDRSLVWASAGHDPALWYHVEKGTIDELPNTGIPLGILDDQEFDEIGPVYFDEGDLLVIGTDGIWETQDADGAFYGKERLEALICSLHDETADKICSKVIEEVVEFGHPNRPEDDVTVVAIKCL